MRTAGIALLTISVAFVVTVCDEGPAIKPNPPAIAGVVVDVDSAETVEGGRFLGAFRLSLADRTDIDVPRGVSYNGPRCVFVEEHGDYGTVRDGSDCVLHIGRSMARSIGSWASGSNPMAPSAPGPLQGTWSR